MPILQLLIRISGSTHKDKLLGLRHSHGSQLMCVWTHKCHHRITPLLRAKHVMKMPRYLFSTCNATQQFLHVSRLCFTTDFFSSSLTKSLHLLHLCGFMLLFYTWRLSFPFLSEPGQSAQCRLCHPALTSCHPQRIPVASGQSPRGSLRGRAPVEPPTPPGALAERSRAQARPGRQQTWQPPSPPPGGTCCSRCRRAAPRRRRRG